MPTYYVATLARYVLVEAPDPAAARMLGEQALVVGAPPGRPPAEVQVVRPATADEIDLMGWHAANVAAEAARAARG
jgi:hypothetical protein